MINRLDTSPAAVDSEPIVFQRSRVKKPAHSDLFRFTYPEDSAELARAQVALSDYALVYFRQLLTQYWTFPTNDEDPTACIHFNLQAISVIYSLILKYKSGNLTWEDLSELETALLRILPEAMLRSQAWVLRARYREIVPPAQFRLYQQSRSSSARDATLPTETLRAEMETLLGEMQKYRTLVPNITQGKPFSPYPTQPWIAGAALVAAGVAAVLHFTPLTSGAAQAWTLLTVAAVGGIGGAVSLLRRFQNSVAHEMAQVNESNTKATPLNLPLAVATGAFFAVLFFFALRFHALQGFVFPEVSQAALSHPLNFGLLTVWAFGAGFAERLAPRVWNFLKSRCPKVFGVFFAALSLLGPGVGAAPPAFHMERTPVKHIRATLTDIWETPAYTPRRWAVFAPMPPTFAGQDHLSTHLSVEGIGEAHGQTTELSPLQRAVLWGRADAPPHAQAASMRLVYEATLYSRHLVPGPATTPVAPLSGTERPLDLRPSETIDYQTNAFRQWLDQNALHRESSESDLDFAKRVYQTIHKNFHYRYDIDQDRKASSICRSDGSDCGGLSNLLVAALRAGGLPARTLGGRLAKTSQKPSDHGQCHVRSEFYTDGIGWVPVDMSYGVGATDQDAQLYFGSDPGDLLTMYSDSDFILSPGQLGPKPVAAFQSLAHWAWGSGSLNGSQDLEDWQVETLPL
jgi:transglutaminase-like putative cysteine protease